MRWKVVSSNIKYIWFVINGLKHVKHLCSVLNHHLTKKIHLSGSDRHKDSRQQLTVQPHVCAAGSQPNGPQSGLLPAFLAPQHQSADWQEVTNDGGRKLGQPAGTRFWTGEDGTLLLNQQWEYSYYRTDRPPHTDAFTVRSSGHLGESEKSFVGNWSEGSVYLCSLSLGLQNHCQVKSDFIFKAQNHKSQFASGPSQSVQRPPLSSDPLL